MLKWKSLYFGELPEMTLNIFGSSTCWKKVLLGEIISDTNEKTSLDVAQKICRYFIEETNAVLQKVLFRNTSFLSVLIEKLFCNLLDRNSPPYWGAVNALVNQC